MFEYDFRTYSLGFSPFTKMLDKWKIQCKMPVCEEYGVNMCVHSDDPPFQVLDLPHIVTNEADIAWFLNAVDNPHNGLTFCAGSLSASEHNTGRRNDGSGTGRNKQLKTNN